MPACCTPLTWKRRALRQCGSIVGSLARTAQQLNWRRLPWCVAILLGFVFGQLPLLTLAKQQPEVMTGASDDLVKAGPAFPCQFRRCGCQTREQCLGKCCCFSREQRLAWFRRQQQQLSPAEQNLLVTSPAVSRAANCCSLRRPVAAASDSQSIAPCDSATGTGCGASSASDRCDHLSDQVNGGRTTSENDSLASGKSTWKPPATPAPEAVSVRLSPEGCAGERDLWMLSLAWSITPPPSTPLVDTSPRLPTQLFDEQSTPPDSTPPCPPPRIRATRGIVG